MPNWIIHEPFTAPTGRDYRPGDTYTADVAPDCDATLVGIPQEDQVDDPATSADEDKPRRGRPPKATIIEAD